MKTLEKLEKSREFWFLLITSFSFFLLRLPSLFEPNWYGDEGIYQVIGLGIRHGRLLYKGIWDNKPPLLYLIYAIFNSSQFWVRLASLLAGILAIVCFFYLARELFFTKKGNPTDLERKSLFITTGLFAFIFGIPLVEGNIANSENFMLFPIILAGFLIFKHNKEEKKLTYYTSFFIPGLLLGLAFLFKIVAVFDLAAFACFIIIVHFGIKKIKNIVEILVPLFTGFALPLALTILFFLLKGSLFDFIHAALVQNVGYVGYGNKFIIPQGFLILKALILGIVLLALFLKKKKLNNTVIFSLTWLSFALFNAFFSQRPYTHYVLVALPAFCLLLGLAISQKTKGFFIVLFLAVLLLLTRNFTYFGKTIYYYQNYLAFIFNKESVYDYRNFFDSNTPRDYRLADYLKLHMTPSDNLFIWGDNAQVYALANKLPPGRYTVAYHINASKNTLLETSGDLKRVNPKFIVVSDSQPFPFALFGYKQRMNIDTATVYERPN